MKKPTNLAPAPRGYIPKYTELDNGLYRIDEDVRYYSPRYNRFVTIYKGTVRDGATGAMDIHSLSWWVHDELCVEGEWDDGTPVTNWQASRALSDILYDERRKWRSKYWFWATFFMGGGQARQNGMFRPNE